MGAELCQAQSNFILLDLVQGIYIIYIFPGVNYPSAAKISKREGGEYIVEEESKTFGSC